MAKRRNPKGSDLVRRADEKWLAGGGLERPPTKIGIETARRLLSRHPDEAKQLKAYIKKSRGDLPVSDWDAEHGPEPKPPRPESSDASRLRYREITGVPPDLASDGNEATGVALEWAKIWERGV